jgi:tripartite-type tricarboxylate transporter receptor subunit TctC
MPGAGSFRLANWLTAIAPRDGTAIGTVSQALVLEELLRSEGVRYKAAEFNWIGRATTVTELIMTIAKVKTIQEAMQQEVVIGSTGPGSPSEGYPRLLNAVAKTKFRIVPGYSASTEVLLAMERGEVDAAVTSLGSLSNYRADWLNRGNSNFLVQGTVERTEALMDVPAVGELGGTPDDRALLQLYASSSSVGRALIAPPGVSPDRVTELRGAFDATIRDPDYIADVRRTKDEFRPLSGIEIQKIVERLGSTSPAVVARMKNVLQ